MADSLRRRDPTVSETELQREKDKAFRAPTIVVVAAKIRKGHKIPEVEQIASASAAAQTIMLAAPALGYGAALTATAALSSSDLPAALIASDDGRGIYQRLGFLPISRFTLWAGA